VKINVTAFVKLYLVQTNVFCTGDNYKHGNSMQLLLAIYPMYRTYVFTKQSYCVLHPTKC